MDPRGALARLFLAGRSPEEQAARMARQHQQSGLGAPAGGAFPPAPDPMTTGAVPIPQARPDMGGGAANVPIPTPSPGPPMGGMIDPSQGVAMGGMVSPGQGLPPMPPSIPGPPMELSPPPMPPPVTGVPPILRGGVPQNSLGGGLPLDLAPSPPRPRDPMAASAPTEIGAYEAKRSRPAAAPKPDRKAQTKKAQSQFRLKAGRG